MVLVRVEEAALGPDAHVRLVLRGVSDPTRLRALWASSGATVEQSGQDLRAVTTVEALSRAAGRCFPPQEHATVDRVLRRTVAAWTGPTPSTVVAGGTMPTDLRPLVVGIVNVTPDSFSDGGLLYGPSAPHPEAAVAHGRGLLADGADLLDIGGESTRPGAEPVAEDEELRRVVPVVEQLAAGGAVVSVDTTKPGVARAAVAAGARVVNDVSGARDPELLEVVAESGAGYVLMHTRGTPRDMASLAEYDDVVDAVYEFLARGIDRCAAAGIPPERVVVDPGLGFAKTAQHNLELLRALPQLRGLGRPVLVGASRKGFLGSLLDGAGAGGRLDGAGAGDRLEASLACAAVAVGCGAALLRVHDVAPTVRAARVAHAVSTAGAVWPRVAPLG